MVNTDKPGKNGFFDSLNQSLLDSIPDEILVISPKDMNIIAANRRVLDDLHMKNSEVLGRKCYKIFHKNKNRCRKCPTRELFRTDRTSEAEHIHYINNERRICSVTVMPIRGPDKKITALLHITKDITKQRAAEDSLKQSKEHYRRLVENAPLGIMSIDTDGRIMEINPVLRSILGIDEINTKRRINALKYPLMLRAGISNGLSECLRSGKSMVSERKYLSRDGKESYLRYNLRPQREKGGSIIGVQAIVENITKKKRYEEEIKGMNLNLLTLFRTSTMLQLTMDVDEILKVAIQAFRSIGYDRVRIYLMKDRLLVGVRASHLSRERFHGVVLEVNRDYPKAYEAIKKKVPVILKELHGKYTDVLEKYDVEESASLPLISRDKIIGIISVDNKYSGIAIKKDELNLLMTFANQIAAAVESAMLYEENLKKLRTLTAMYDVSSALSGTIDLEKILNLIVIKIVKLLRADVCSVLLLDDEGKKLLPKTIYDIRGEFPKDTLLEVENSVCGKVIKDLAYHYIPNIQKEPGVVPRKYAKNTGLVSMLCLPLALENVPIGVINIFTKKKREYSSEELSLLASLSNQAAIMIENSKLYERIKDDKDNLSTLLEISQAINSTLDQDRLLSLILDKTVEFTRAEFGFLMLIEDEYLDVKLSRGQLQDLRKRKKLKIGEGISGWVAKYRKPLIVGDVSKDSRYVEFSPEIRSEAAIPLIMQSEVLGVLNLASKRLNNFRRFRKSLNLLTNQIAIAIENAKLYDKIENFNKRLKHEIELATKELREKNIELKKIDSLKSDFVSNVSHELRTPLTSITGYTKLMHTGKLGPINDKQSQGLKIVAEESERLTRLINDVLDLSRLESGKIKYKLEMINIREIAEGVVSTLRHNADEKKINLKLKVPSNMPQFKASRDLVKQVLINLLNNALKFTPENGRIDIIIKKKGHDVEVTVKDTGEGIPESKIPKLFNKFYQVDSSMTREHGGTGLGLVICKHIIDAHKGTIRVESVMGKGSSFIFTLPLRK